jgi:4-diphosphocytidyl-2-C-methyl-D-erythritol kinase
LPVAMLINDLQGAALSLAPQIEGALRALRAAGADQATLCGSGPTAVGHFWGPRASERAAAAAATLAGEHPAAVAAVPVARSADRVIRARLRSGAQSAGR